MNFKIVESEEEFYDYKTGDVVDKVLFDTNKAEASYYDGILHDSDYYKSHKNKYGKIVWMTPNEYYKVCAEDIFGVDVQKLKAGRNADSKVNDFLKRVITEQKKKFPIAVIDFTTMGQEGLHRMSVAGELSGWEFKQPVLIIDWYDKELHAKAVENEKRNTIQRKVERALSNSLRYEYSNIDEFKEQLSWDLDSEFNINYEDDSVEFNLNVENEDCVITVDGVDVSFPVSDIKIVDSDDDVSDLESEMVDDIDISDIDFSDDGWLKDFIK